MSIKPKHYQRGTRRPLKVMKVRHVLRSEDVEGCVARAIEHYAYGRTNGEFEENLPDTQKQLEEMVRDSLYAYGIVALEDPYGAYPREFQDTAQEMIRERVKSLVPEFYDTE